MYNENVRVQHCLEKVKRNIEFKESFKIIIANGFLVLRGVVGKNEKSNEFNFNEALTLIIDICT